MDLKVIDGGSEPEQYVECPKCDCMTFIELRQMIRRTKKGTDAGMKVKACAVCFIKGDMVIL